MKNLLIIGTGGFAREVYFHAHEQGPLVELGRKQAAQGQGSVAARGEHGTGAAQSDPGRFRVPARGRSAVRAGPVRGARGRGQARTGRPVRVGAVGAGFGSPGVGFGA